LAHPMIAGKYTAYRKEVRVPIAGKCIARVGSRSNSVVIYVPARLDTAVKAIERKGEVYP